jgi:hypothetical protein
MHIALLNCQLQKDSTVRLMLCYAIRVQDDQHVDSPHPSSFIHHYPIWSRVLNNLYWHEQSYNSGNLGGCCTCLGMIRRVPTYLTQHPCSSTF